MAFILDVPGFGCFSFSSRKGATLYHAARYPRAYAVIRDQNPKPPKSGKSVPISWALVAGEWQPVEGPAPAD